MRPRYATDPIGRACAGGLVGRAPRRLIVGLIAGLILFSTARVFAQPKSSPPQNDVAVRGRQLADAFQHDIKPLLNQFCIRCHNPDKMMSGIRVDQLDGTVADKRLFLWDDILTQVESEAMPPEDQRSPTPKQREQFIAWIREAKQWAKSRNAENHGATRRLTVTQYRNTLQALLGIREDFTDILPPDAVSKDGFTNNAQAMTLSPLQIEAYFNIAEQALDAALVDVDAKPVIQNFRVDLGRRVNRSPCPDKLILGANSHLLANEDFQVVELEPKKPFDFEPFVMRTAYEFNEGYQGNSTVRGWRKYDSIYHAVFACMRGSGGYPLGRAYSTVPNGLLLRPAIPSAELFGQSSTYGPQANFKISLRELPNHGNFRITVRAAKYDDALLLDQNAELLDPEAGGAIDLTQFSGRETNAVSLTQPGVFQVEVSFIPGKKPEIMELELGERMFARQLFHGKKQNANSNSNSDSDSRTTAMLVVRLPQGETTVRPTFGDNSRLKRIVFRPVDEKSDLHKRFVEFSRRSPRLGVHLGLRRDCGSTLARVGEIRNVSRHDAVAFVFEGAITDYPSPSVEENNVNYLAGVREIGVRSEYTDGRAMPRLRIESVEFEGPYYESWPPQTHQNVFFESENRDDVSQYAREVITAFATKAFRRIPVEAELDLFQRVWQESYSKSGEFRQSIKDALIVVLTSPQFLFYIEDSQGPQAETLDDYEVASKLSYFLWNGPPDERLLRLAGEKNLADQVAPEVERMIRDPRSRRFVDVFATEWLALDKFDVVEIDRKRYPMLTRDAKTELRQEPAEFFNYLLRENLPLRTMIQSDFIVANEVVASYYGLGAKANNGFQFSAIQHNQSHLGGLLTQPAILAGLSDGRESNPVKRGAWFARKIIAEPPDDPPPNVPQLPDDDNSQLTLREKLEQHRNQQGCAKCHEGIDPWGVPFEAYDAGGLLKAGKVDAQSTLPDHTTVDGVEELREYLTRDRMDQVAFSFAKHIAMYAAGRSLTYSEIAFLKESIVELRKDEYRTQAIIQFVVQTDMFMKK